MKPQYKIAAAGAALLLAGCVSMPSGPSVAVMPGTGKSFDQFRADDVDCRQYASSQVGGGTPDSAAEGSGVKSAAVGAAVGAAAGAIMGGRQGAATGAGVGLIGGSVAGAGAAGSSQYALQNRYNIGYMQCMYAKGHQVPMSGHMAAPQQRTPAYTTPPPPPPGAAAPAASATIPPPPPGSPPPPPPGVTN
jgi:hypothetical protein